MRRALATFLLSLLTIPAIVPVLLAGDRSLPACCRRDGKHHCAMSDEAPSGAGLKAVMCPLLPKPAVAAPAVQLILPGAAWAPCALPVFASVSVPVNRSVGASHGFFVLKRGPPSNFC